MKKQELSLAHNYRASDVSTAEKSPVIIMLHGYGSDENDLFSFASELPSKYTIISLKAPYPMQPYGNAWYAIHFDNIDGKWSDDAQAIESREKVITCIDEIVEKYHIDSNNITLLGFSQGTILSFAVALSYPEKIKNVIGLSGYINESIVQKDYQANDFKSLSVYSSHGNVDQVIPVDWARKTAPFLKKIGVKCDYSEFPIGHGVSPQNFHDLNTWLEHH